MRQKSGPEKQPAEDAIRDIRRATRRHFSAEEKIRIVLEGLRGEESIAAERMSFDTRSGFAAAKNALIGEPSQNPVTAARHEPDGSKSGSAPQRGRRPKSPIIKIGLARQQTRPILVLA